MPPRGFQQMNRAMPRFPMGSLNRPPIQPGGRMFQTPMRMSPFGMRPPLAGGRPKQGAAGLLSRLFQRGGAPSQANNVANAATGFQRGGGGGSILGNLSNIANPGKISSFLNNTQNVIRTAQQIGPMVQQYGPLVKNLPAMWRMYKGLKSADTEEETASNVTESTQESNSHKVKTASSNRSESFDLQESTDDYESSSDDLTQKSKKGSSIPKLYI